MNVNEFYFELIRLANLYPGLAIDGARAMVDEYGTHCMDERERKAYSYLANVLYAFANGDDIVAPIERLLEIVKEED